MEGVDRLTGRDGETSPLVTVAIPTRNRSDMLCRCLESVLAQTLSELEIYVSDNASTDDTKSVVESFGDARIHYLRLDDNIGLWGNLSRCLDLGEAPFITVLAADDMMLRENLERMIHFLQQHPRVGMVHYAFQVSVY